MSSPSFRSLLCSRKSMRAGAGARLLHSFAGGTEFLSTPSHSPAPLTQLSEEEQFFYNTVRRFAEETIAPQVRAMDDEQQLASGILQKLTELGLMGIELTEALGG